MQDEKSTYIFILFYSSVHGKETITTTKSKASQYQMSRQLIGFYSSFLFKPQLQIPLEIIAFISHFKIIRRENITLGKKKYI